MPINECLGKVYLQNGRLTGVAQFDDTFLLSQSYIYEVFRVQESVALFLEDHLSRLEQTCQLSNYCPGFDVSEVYDQVYALIGANNLETGNIKVVLRLDDKNQPDFRVYINPHQYPTQEQYSKGVDISLFKAIRNNPNAKVMDLRLRNATNLAKEQLNVYETLLVDDNGCITEGSRSNVFFIRNDKVITSPVEDVLPGITRKHVMEVCRQLQIDLLEEKVPARSLVVMEALFISGTSRKVLPVRQVDSLDFDPAHPILLKIRKGFDEKVKHYIRRQKQQG